MAVRCPADVPPCVLVGLSALTAALIDDLNLVSAVVDAFSDCRELPASATAALTSLEAIAASTRERAALHSRWYRWLRRSGPTNMGIEVDLRGEQRHLIEAFGPYSIHCERADPDGQVVVVLHDSGTSVSLTPTDRVPEAEVRGVLEAAGVAFDLR